MTPTPTPTPTAVLPLSLGYASLYANGLNNNSQIRRSVDMIYQRGGSYDIVLTGNTYIPSMVLDVDLFSDDSKVGRMSLVPASVDLSGSTYNYTFNLRPYNYLSNYIQTEHYQTYTLNDFYTTSLQINYNNPYPNEIKANFKYGYRYITGNTTIYETSYQNAGSPQNDLNHFTEIPECLNDLTLFPSGYTSTGNYFDYVGGSFQMDEKFILPNFDQEIGTIIGTGFTQSSMDVFRRPSPMSQFLLDYPTVPEQ